MLDYLLDGPIDLLDDNPTYDYDALTETEVELLETVLSPLQQ